MSRVVKFYFLLLCLLSQKSYGLNRPTDSKHFHPVFKNCQHFLQDMHIEDDDDWKGLVPRLREIFNNPKLQETFQSYISRFSKLYRKDTREEQARVYEKYFEENVHENVKILWGGSAHVIAFPDLKIVAYLPGRRLFSSQNNYESYNYHIMTRLLVYKWYKHFKKQYDLEYFKINKTKALLLNKNISCDQIFDDNCIVISKFLNSGLNSPVNCIDINSGKNFFIQEFLNLLSGDEDSAKFIRDNILGLCRCCIWDYYPTNIMMVPHNNKWQVRVVDSEFVITSQPAESQNPFHLEENDGKRRIAKPWEPFDKEKMETMIAGVIDAFLKQLILRNRRHFVNFTKELVKLLVSFVNSENPSACLLIHMLQQFDIQHDGGLTNMLKYGRPTRMLSSCQIPIRR